MLPSKNDTESSTKRQLVFLSASQMVSTLVLKKNL